MLKDIIGLLLGISLLVVTYQIKMQVLQETVPSSPEAVSLLHAQDQSPDPP